MRGQKEIKIKSWVTIKDTGVTGRVSDMHRGVYSIDNCYYYHADQLIHHREKPKKKK